MGISLVGFVLIIIGCYLHQRGSNGLEIPFYAIGSMLVFGVMVVIYVTSLEARTAMVEYHEDKKFIEGYYNNKNITGEERKKINNIILNDNTCITMHREYSNDFWVGIFFPSAIARLDLFDYKKIPEANTQLQVKEVK